MSAHLLKSYRWIVERLSPAKMFASEVQLVEQLLGWLPTFLSARASFWRVDVEFSVGRSIADVVALLWDDDALPCPTPLTSTESLVVAYLRRHGSTRIDLLEKRCYMEARALRGARLLDSGLINRLPGGVLSLNTAWAGAFSIVAIEAKLADWKKALTQAAVYLGYADEAYVALPCEKAEQVRACGRHLFDDQGVGLLGVGEVGVIKLQPKSEVRHGWQRDFVASRMRGAKVVARDG